MCRKSPSGTTWVLACLFFPVYMYIMKRDVKVMHAHGEGVKGAAGGE